VRGGHNYVKRRSLTIYSVLYSVPCPRLQFSTQLRATSFARWSEKSVVKIWISKKNYNTRHTAYVRRSSAKKTRRAKQNGNKIQIYLYISYAEELKPQKWCPRLTYQSERHLRSYCRLHQAFMQGVNASNGNRQTGAFQWRWPHSQRHAACNLLSVYYAMWYARSHFWQINHIFQVQLVFSQMQLACHSYYACIQPEYAGCSRLYACMQDACVSSVNPA